ncbi:MAG: hypothetical protein JWR50_882 [Mucilaginibacter sp.]|nr:hypothetical protein [Mucilaginibacter sp.]
MILNKIYKFAYMRFTKVYIFFALLVMIVMVACNHKSDKKTGQEQGQAVAKPDTTPVTLKGLYSFAPGAKTFQACGKQTEFWVADSSAQLELQYAQVITFEQHGDPVYVEVEGRKIKSAKGGEGAAYDSTLIVKKLLKLTKEIPVDCK